MKTRSNYEKEVEKLTVEDLENILNIDKSSFYYREKLNVIQEFKNKQVREDHFENKGKSLFKLSAKVRFERILLESEKKEVLDIIFNLPIRPSYIWDNDDNFELYFFPKMQFHFNSWLDYLKLIIDFINYIEQVDILRLSYLDSLNDDPEYIDESAPILSNIKFDKNTFDNKEIIFHSEEVIYRFKLK